MNAVEKFNVTTEIWGIEIVFADSCMLWAYDVVSYHTVYFVELSPCSETPNARQINHINHYPRTPGLGYEPVHTKSRTETVSKINYT